MLSLGFLPLFVQCFLWSGLSLSSDIYSISDANVTAKVLSASSSTSKDTHVASATLTFPPKSHNGSVPTSIANSSSSQLVTSTPSTTLSTSSPSLPTASALTTTSDLDLLTIASRRIEFITVEQIGANSLPAWFVLSHAYMHIFHLNTTFRLSTLGADGKWPDSEVNYATGCAAQRANWPAADHWVRISAYLSCAPFLSERKNIAALAAAWRGGFAGASPTYVKSSALRTQIGQAMDWWFDRDFTVASCLDKGGIGTCQCSTPGERFVFNLIYNYHFLTCLPSHARPLEYKLVLQCAFLHLQSILNVCRLVYHALPTGNTRSPTRGTSLPPPQHNPHSHPALKLHAHDRALL